MRKYFFRFKVTFHFEGGGSMVVKCDDCTLTKLSSSVNREVNMKGADRTWTVDVSKLVGVTVKKYFCINFR